MSRSGSDRSLDGFVMLCDTDNRPLGPTNSRKAFSQLKDADGDLEEFAKVFSEISHCDGWAAYSPSAQNRLVVVLLAATVRSLDMDDNSSSANTLEEYEAYLDRCFSIHCRFTDSRDAIKLRQLTPYEVSCAKNARSAGDGAALKQVIRSAWSRPTLLVVASLGLVYWDFDCGELRLRLTQTAVELPIEGVETYAKSIDTCQYRLDVPITPIGRRKQRDAIEAVARSVTERAGCERLARGFVKAE